MRRKSKRILAIFVTSVILICLWIGLNTYPIWRDYLEGPPVLFLENEDISLGLYPRDFQSAAVFTNDDIYALTPIEAIEKLRVRLERLGVKGTFFVIPFYHGQNELDPGQPVVAALKRLQTDGNEIAQHGYFHYCDKNKSCGAEASAEMLLLDRAEQIDRIRRGREILVASGFSPRGHRSPCFSGKRETFLALEELGFLYGSDLALPPRTPRTLFQPAPRKRIIYPYHPSGLKLLEITAQPDPTVYKRKAMKVFERFHRRQGVFAFLTHTPDLGEDENLDRLAEFINYLQMRNTWLCRLDELCSWWLVRERINIQTEHEDETLIITYENPSDSPLENAGVVFKESDEPLSNYRLVDRERNVSTEGFIPPSRRIVIDLPPT